MLQNNFIEITLRHGRSPVHLLHFFGTPLYKNTYGELLLKDKLGGKIMTKFVALRAKMHAYRKIDKKLCSC